MATRGKGKWKPPAGFGTGFGIENQGSGIPYALIKNARHSGQLNLSNRGLAEVPNQVWRINIDVPEEGKHVSLDTGSGDRWWEQIDLKKLILASNQLKELSPEIKNLPALNVLDVHDNKIVSLPDELCELQELSRLNLSHNSFSVVPVSITTVQSIQILLLNGNSLKDLPSEFGNLINLEDLDLGDNKLISLPESFGNLKKLRKLNLGSNQLESLPQGFRNLSVLQYLNLGSNKLKALPEGLDQMTSLDILDCRANLISEFPPLGGDVNLKELYLSNNRIRQINAEMFKFLPLMVTFDAKDNTIQSIPEEIALCCKLERLDLTNNCLSILPFVLGNMEGLKSLSLDGNPLRGIRRDILAKGTQAVLSYLKSRIPPSGQQKSDQNATKGSETEINDNTLSPGCQIDMHKISSTKKIDYCNKKLTSVPDDYFVADVVISVVDFSKNLLSEVPSRLSTYSSSLVELNLSSNKITTIPPELAVLQRLTFLDLGSNMISDIPDECRSWRCLSQLIISANRFKALPKFLFEIATLETILASSNQISDIDVDGLKRLPRISTLDLSNNNIANVPPELGNVTSLKSLQLEGNSFRNPRHNILTRGTAQVLEYLRDRIPR